MCEKDIYEKLFIKMAKIGFPQEFGGVKMKYEYDNYVCDICFDGDTEKKILKMWRLLNE